MYTRRTGRSAWVAAMIGQAVLPAVALADPPSLVYVYNGGKRGYDAGAEGRSWQGAGFLDKDGTPLETNPNGDIVVGDEGRVVGRALKKSNGTIYGWQNDATKTAIVDINVGTFTQAFDLVSNTGRIEVIKHGVTTGTGTTAVKGGVVQLDNGNFFRGFNKNNTGVPGYPTYPLPGRPGAKITINFNACWSALDPDGPSTPQQTNPMTSFTSTAETIPGVRSATGESGLSWVKSEPELRWGKLPDGVTEELVNTAINAVAQGRPGGFETVEAWFDSLLFKDKMKELRRLYGSVQVGDDTIKLKLNIRYTAGEGSSGNLDFPVTLSTPPGGTVDHVTPYVGELTGQVDVLSTVDLDAYPTMESFHLARYGELPADAPAGTRSSTGIYALSAIDGLTEQVNGRVTLDYAAEHVAGPLHLYTLTGGAWRPLLGNEQVDPVTGKISANFTWAGLGGGDDAMVVAGFALVPEPASLALLLAGALGSLRRRNALP